MDKIKLVSRPVNWNKIEDPIDMDVWNRLTSTLVAREGSISNDIQSWEP